ncbi:MAG: hypothetical protein ACPF83_04875 [Flavobacteriales bacterium]
MWPSGFEEASCAGHGRCRFEPNDYGTPEIADISSILSKAVETGLDVIKTEHRYTFDGVRATPLTKPVGGMNHGIETLSRMRGCFLSSTRGSEKCSVKSARGDQGKQGKRSVYDELFHH